MNLPDRDRRDLEELAGIFLSPAPAPPAVAPAPTPRPPEADAPGLPPLVLVASLAEDDDAPESRELVRTAARTGRTHSLPADRPGEIHPLLRFRPRRETPPDERPGILPVPSRDGPALRFGLAASPRVLAWLPARPGLLAALEDFLLVLREGCPDPALGWLRHPALPYAPVEAVLSAFAARVPPARVTALGTWQPGEPLPEIARAFLLEAPPARLVPPAPVQRPR